MQVNTPYIGPMGVYLNSKPQDAISNECRNCHDPFWSPKNEKPLGGQGFMGGALQILVVPIPRKAHFGRPKNRLSTVDPVSIFMDWVERLPLASCQFCGYIALINSCFWFPLIGGR